MNDITVSVLSDILDDKNIRRETFSDVIVHVFMMLVTLYAVSTIETTASYYFVMFYMAVGAFSILINAIALVKNDRRSFVVSITNGIPDKYITPHVLSFITTLAECYMFIASGHVVLSYIWAIMYVLHNVLLLLSYKRFKAARAALIGVMIAYLGKLQSDGKRYESLDGFLDVIKSGTNANDIIDIAQAMSKRDKIIPKTSDLMAVFTNELVKVIK